MLSRSLSLFARLALALLVVTNGPRSGFAVIASAIPSSSYAASTGEVCESEETGKRRCSCHCHPHETKQSKSAKSEIAKKPGKCPSSKPCIDEADSGSQCPCCPYCPAGQCSCTVAKVTNTQPQYAFAVDTPCLEQGTLELSLFLPSVPPIELLQVPRS